MSRSTHPKSRKAVAPAVKAKASPIEPAWLRIAVLALSGICLLGLFSTEAHDTDFWWHLKTGQYIVEHRALPVPDPFAYTTAINPPAYPGEEQVRHFNLTHEWLSQILMYGVFWLGGLPAIVLARALLLASVCALVGVLVLRRTGGIYWAVAAAFATASLGTVVTIDRPMIVTFLFVATFITLLEIRNRAIWAIPGLALIWANCHGGFFLGWVILLIYCVATRDSRVWIVSACAIALSALNPNGFGVVSVLLRYRQSAMTASLIEWQRPYLWGQPYAFDLLLYAAVLVLILSWRKVRLSDWLLFGAFAGAALVAFRNIFLVGIVAPLLIATYFPWRMEVERFVSWGVALLAVGILATGLARGSMFQLRSDLWRFPSGAADYLLANHVPGPLFNTYEHGGYLIWRLWPEQKVFIDGRAISEAAHKDYWTILSNSGGAPDQISGRRAELINRYGINTVVMNTFQYNTGMPYSLAAALGNPATSEWQLVYDDPQSLVFRRNPPPGTPVFADKGRRVLEHMETECTSNIEHSPLAFNCAKTLANLWLSAGNAAHGRQMLQLYLKNTVSRDPEAEAVMRQLGGTTR